MAGADASHIEEVAELRSREEIMDAQIRGFANLKSDAAANLRSRLEAELIFGYAAASPCTRIRESG